MGQVPQLRPGGHILESYLFAVLLNAVTLRLVGTGQCRPRRDRTVGVHWPQGCVTEPRPEPSRPAWPQEVCIHTGWGHGQGHPTLAPSPRPAAAATSHPFMGLVTDADARVRPPGHEPKTGTLSGRGTQHIHVDSETEEGDTETQEGRHQGSFQVHTLRQGPSSRGHGGSVSSTRSTCVSLAAGSCGGHTARTRDGVTRGVPGGRALERPRPPARYLQRTPRWSSVGSG